MATSSSDSTSSAPRLELHPDRLFPADSTVRGITRELYDQVKDLPIISPHGHVPPAWLSENPSWSDPTSLLITPDHYVNRMLHANGVDLARLGVNQPNFGAAQAREAFRVLCANWRLYRGTPVKFWFETIFADVFGITVRPSAETADEIYDEIDAKLKTDEYRPRELFDRFGIEVMATTDDPCDDLTEHAALRDDPSFHGRVLPTFRPDKYLEPARPDWNASTDRLAEVSGISCDTLDGWLQAMRARRDHFLAHGAVSTDHSHADAGTERLSDGVASRLYSEARAGKISETDGARLRRHFLNEMAAMAADDGLVMTLHPAVYRNHHTPTFEAFGADVGCDIPISVEFTRALQPMLARYGASEKFQLILFTLDETVFSREIGPLAGFYPGVYAGAPWWFLDAPEAIRRYRSAITESAGFGKTSGFIDDTRAFCSIPARHDMSRRLDAGFVAQLVAEHRLAEDEAAEVIVDLVSNNPRKAFKL